jgi:membrane-associated phospholipid phosphatase
MKLQFSRLRPSQLLSAWFGGTSVAIVASYFWLDRPIALVANAELKQFDLFEKLTHLPEIASPLVIIAFGVVGMHALAGKSLSRWQTVAVLCAASLAVAAGVKDQLKFAFGRTWPETWVRNNPSFIHDGVYGFFPFHGGPGYAAFPSGHTAAICAVMSVLWICYPRGQILYALVMTAVAVGLVGADFHFLSDVIAGAFLGCTTGYFTVLIWNLGRRPVLGEPSAEAKSTLGGLNVEAGREKMNRKIYACNQHDEAEKIRELSGGEPLGNATETAYISDERVVMPTQRPARPKPGSFGG